MGQQALPGIGRRLHERCQGGRGDLLHQEQQAPAVLDEERRPQQVGRGEKDGRQPLDDGDRGTVDHPAQRHVLPARQELAGACLHLGQRQGDGQLRDAVEIHVRRDLCHEARRQVPAHRHGGGNRHFRGGVRRQQRPENVLGDPGTQRGRQQAAAARQSLVEGTMRLVEGGAAGIVQGGEFPRVDVVDAGQAVGLHFEQGG
jgi:hypothetical protein